MNITASVSSIKWGEKSLVSLYISVLSGVVLALQYDPRYPFYSAVSIDMLIPFGSFWRSLHFYSSQIFFLFSVIHIWAVIYNGSYLRLATPKWLLLIGSVPVSVLLLFTGYVLRGDTTGESAGIIAEQLCLTIPYLGELVNSSLFAVSEEGVKRIYANHLIGLGVLWGVLVWDHLRRYRANIGKHGLLIIAVLCVSTLWMAPIEPMIPGMSYISGPWFFLGIQELLRYIHPLWAGIMFPVVFIGALMAIRFENPWRRNAVLFSVLWVTVYTVVTIIAWLR